MTFPVYIPSKFVSLLAESYDMAVLMFFKDHNPLSPQKIKINLKLLNII